MCFETQQDFKENLESEKGTFLGKITRLLHIPELRVFSRDFLQNHHLLEWDHETDTCTWFRWMDKRSIAPNINLKKHLGDGMMPCCLFPTNGELMDSRLVILLFLESPIFPNSKIFNRDFHVGVSAWCCQNHQFYPFGIVSINSKV